MAMRTKTVTSDIIIHFHPNGDVAASMRQDLVTYDDVDGQEISRVKSGIVPLNTDDFTHEAATKTLEHVMGETLVLLSADNSALKTENETLRLSESLENL